MAEPPPRSLPPKREVALLLLEAESVYIHLDPRREGVLVPKGFTKQPQLVLQIGLNQSIRIPDLTIDEDGISCTLFFNRVPFWCRMPWDSIYALVGPDGRGQLWPEDVPPEVESLRTGRSKGHASPKRPRPRLTSSKEGSGEGGHPITEELPVSDPDVRARDIDGAGKRARPQPRPALAAVPSSGPDRAPPRIDRNVPLGAHSRPGGSRPGGRPGSHPGGRPGAAPTPEPPRKPKRELPPYLRIVK